MSDDISFHFIYNSKISNSYSHKKIVANFFSIRMITLFGISKTLLSKKSVWSKSFLDIRNTVSPHADFARQ